MGCKSKKKKLSRFSFVWTPGNCFASNLILARNTNCWYPEDFCSCLGAVYPEDLWSWRTDPYLLISRRFLLLVRCGLSRGSLILEGRPLFVVIPKISAPVCRCCISRGTLILEDRPLFVVPPHVHTKDPKQVRRPAWKFISDRSFWKFILI